VSVVEQLATFVARSSYEDLSLDARLQLKIRMLDVLGCAIGASSAETPRLVREYATSWSSDGPCSFIGGGHGAPDRAALVNGALGRYLDFNDSYLAPGETCHPSDNLAAVLAAAELTGADGRTLLAALAVAYQVQCRLSDAGPVRKHGFDHTTHLAYSAAAGAARALGMDAQRTMNAIAIAGTALNALRVTRTGALSNWKGLAAPFAGSAALEATLLARRGITGPVEVFEGNKGLFDAITGPFAIDWLHEDMERVTASIVKKFNAEIHSQTAIQTALDLKRKYGFGASDIAMVQLDVFDVAYNIIGGGEEGDKTLVRTKEAADHSLPYLIAVALLDGTVMPQQYEPARIQRPDVQQLLRHISVRPDGDFSARFPREMPSRVTVTLRDGRDFSLERRDYLGFRTSPMSWEDVRSKFMALGAPHADPETLSGIASAVKDIESVAVRDLTHLLAAVHAPARSSAAVAA
jgi:2-methylcitrate dehydratase